MSKVTVSEHTNGELRDFALYDLYERSIPSMIDGFKPSHRKAVYTAYHVARNKKIKTIALVGYTFPVGKFHHGDSSMSSCIVRMAAPHANNVPILDGEGTFGSRLVPAAASPRYTEVGLHKNFFKYFPDVEISPENPDSEHPEPVFYLPIIPWVLVNGSQGIATGFATNILPRSPKDISALCIDYLKGKKLPQYVTPSFPHFTGNIQRDGTSWVVFGALKRNSPTKFVITELPVGYDREKYIAILDKLEDSKVIISYEDECSKNGFRFSVTLPRASKNITDEKLLVKMKLVKRVTDNITTIDQNGELKIHDHIRDLIADFCDYRLEMYNKRYAYYIARDEEKRNNLKERVRFIELVLDSTIVFKNQSKAEVQYQLQKLKFKPDDRSKLIELPMHALTKDALARVSREIKELDSDIHKWQTIDTKKQYSKELKLL